MPQKTDREILGYSRWLVLIVAFLAMALISPYQYAWSSISPILSERFGWTLSRIEAIYTLYMIFQALLITLLQSNLFYPYQ